MKKRGRGRPRKGTPSWVADWLKHQAENYLRENADHFDKNGSRFWAMTEQQVIGLCRIIYMAVDKHPGGRGEGLGVYIRREKDEERKERGGENKYEDFVDYPISASLRHGWGRVRKN